MILCPTFYLGMGFFQNEYFFRFRIVLYHTSLFLSQTHNVYKPRVAVKAFIKRTFVTWKNKWL